MSRLLPWPPSYDKRPSTTPAPPLPYLVRYLSFLSLLLLMSFPSLTAAQDPASLFLTDQPRHYVTYPGLSGSNATARIPFTINYLSTVTIVTSNASYWFVVITASNVAIFSQYPATPAGLTSTILGPSHDFGTSYLVDQCTAADSNRTGVCQVEIAAYGVGQSTFFYSVYTTTPLAYNTVNTNTATLSNHFTYYTKYITNADLPVSFDLTWRNPVSAGLQTPLYTLMLVANERAIFTPFYPPPPLSANGSTATIDLYSDQVYVLSSSTSGSAGVLPGLYVIGLWCNSSMYRSSALTVTANYQSSIDGGSADYATVLSVLALTLAAAVCAVVMFRVAILCRRRRTQLVVLTRAEAAMHDPTSDGTHIAMPVYTLPRQHHGATEAEIAALLTAVYVKSVASSGSDGSEGSDDDEPRCTICLEELVPTVSHITTLRCAHTFHSACVSAWLRQRRYCPLCLQLFDKAHDVKRDKEKQRAPESFDVQMVPMPSSADSSRPATASVASVTAVDVDGPDWHEPVLPGADFPSPTARAVEALRLFEGGITPRSGDVTGDVTPSVLRSGQQYD